MATPTRTVEQVLREGGFTRFHRQVVAITGFAWTFVAFEIILISFVLPVALAEFNVVNPVVYGAIGAATLMGSFVGSLGLGRLADNVGRRPVFQACVLWYSLFTALTAASFNEWSLFGFRFLAGLGLGGMLVVDPAILSEYLPPQHRGRYMVFLDFFWPIGFALAIGMSYIFLVMLGNAWRLLFVVAAFPIFIAFLFRLVIPESPFYLARKGRRAEASEVLQRITGRPVTADAIAQEAEIPKAPAAALFRGSLLRRTGVTISNWIALNFSYYGLFIWLPFALAASVVTELARDVNLLYTFLFISALAQFPGYGSSMYLVERWGRKRTLATFLVLGGVSGYVFATARDFWTLVIGLVFVSFFNLGAWGAVYPYTSELFPTQYRATGFGIAEGVGKITAILGPVLFGVLFLYSRGIILPLTVIALVMVVGGLMAAAFGPETKGQPFA